MRPMEQANLFSSIIGRAKAGELGDDDIADIAVALAKSGELMPSWGKPTADLASTGGPVLYRL